jgi:rhodanese-related sulfurtransferase
MHFHSGFEQVTEPAMNSSRLPMRFPVMLLCLVGLMAVGCSKKTSDRDLVLISPDQGQTLVNNQKRALLGLGDVKSGVWVDPRPAYKYAAGHIPGAINLPLKEIMERQDELKKFNVLIIYGEDYGDPVAIGMSKKLLQLQFKDVRTLEGGLKAWEESGRRIVKGTAPDGD